MLKSFIPLFGTWSGEGLAVYPTTDDTQYTERLTFQPDDAQSLIQYEQKTWDKVDGSQSHWEFGFVRPGDNQTVELANVQSGGRGEVMTGTLLLIENGIKLTMISTHFSNDERMLEATREIIVEGNTLSYQQQMAIKGTSKLTLHLSATLTRAAG